MIGPLIFFPFILLALMIVARSHLFDNWQIGNSILVDVRRLRAVVAGHGRAAQLRRRRRAREGGANGMQADLLWLKGSGPRVRRAGRAVPGPDRSGPRPAPGRVRAVLPAAAGAARCWSRWAARAASSFSSW